MNTVERFRAQMHYQRRDRSVIWDFNFWRQTIDVWHEQGLPRSVQHHYTGSMGTDAFFGIDPTCQWLARPGLLPHFEEKVLEDRGDQELAQQHDGVQVVRAKHIAAIPHHEKHLLVDRASWRKHYKPRLDPDHPDRVGADTAKQIEQLRAKGHVVVFSAGSLFGWLRDWMGMENIAMTVYDDPAWFEEMVTTIADCVVGCLERSLEAGATFDGAAFWEDMCYNAGPLLGPQHFKRYLVPQYRRITDVLLAHGVDVIWVDCDGCIDQLLPLWLEAGVNCMFPVEIGTWQADPVKYRKQYGKQLLMMGGFDKRILARTKDQIEAEIVRLTPLVEEGGFIGFCDHRVPPDVPLANYCFYMVKVRQLWGKDTDLPAIDPVVAKWAAKA